MAGFIKVANISDVAPETMQIVQADGLPIIVANVAGEFFAIEANCPHRSAPLIQGKLWGTVIECPWHHYRYDLQTGENIYPRNVYPADLPYLQKDLKPLRCYPVWVEGDELFIKF